jgi:choline dehydrogenase
MNAHFDTIVIGAGSGGGVAASRLSEDPGRSILLLEAGVDFPHEADMLPLVAVSSEHTWRVSGAPEFDWGFFDFDRAGRRNGRPIRLPRGRLVGGTSMVNSTIAVRPAASDLDRWASLGNAGWDYLSLLPLFRRIETDRDFGDSALHGGEGPIVINRYRRESWAPVNGVFADACDEAGLIWSDDLNNPDSDAGVVGAMPHNRFKEAKQGTLNTYLRIARGRKNLTIQGGALVDRILISGGRIKGVRWAGPEGSVETTADRIVLAAGVYNTPAVLMRSGIGEAARLADLGVKTHADLPVGRGLTDHPGCPFFFSADSGNALTGRLFATILRDAAREEGKPWWQLHPFPADEEEGLSGFFVFLCSQQASGTVAIRDADPRSLPIVDHDYLADPSDIARFRDAFEMIRRLVAQPAFRRVNARLLHDGADFESYVKATLASAHHQNGGCRMSPDPKLGVVGPDLEVHGVDGLYVADSSVFPDNIVHNTNLTCYVIGEKVADHIRRRS